MAGFAPSSFAVSALGGASCLAGAQSLAAEPSLSTLVAEMSTAAVVSIGGATAGSSLFSLTTTGEVCARRRMARQTGMAFLQGYHGSRQETEKRSAGRKLTGGVCAVFSITFSASVAMTGSGSTGAAAMVVILERGRRFGGKMCTKDFQCAVLVVVVQQELYSSSCFDCL